MINFTPFRYFRLIRNGDLITSENLEPNLTGFKNLSGLVLDIIEFSFLSTILVRELAKVLFDDI